MWIASDLKETSTDSVRIYARQTHSHHPDLSLQFANTSMLLDDGDRGLARVRKRSLSGLPRPSRGRGFPICSCPLGANVVPARVRAITYRGPTFAVSFLSTKEFYMNLLSELGSIFSGDDGGWRC